MKNEKNINLYEVFATVAILVSLLVVAGTTAFAREAESGGGSGGSGGSSSGSASASSASSGFDSTRDIQERAAASAGVDLRGDGTVEDNGADDIVNGVKLRGDGTVDDDQPVSGSASASASTGVDLRGDGTVDDNLPRRSGVDSARDIQERASSLSSDADSADVSALKSLLERLKAFFGMSDVSGADSARDVEENASASGASGSISIERNNDLSGRDSARDSAERGASSGESPLVDNSGRGSSSDNSGPGSSSDDSSRGGLIAGIADGMGRLLSDLARVFGF